MGDGADAPREQVRRAAKVDGNHAEIVKALREVGARTVYLREPVDLLVGFRGINLLLEVKDLTASRKDKLSAAEQAFFDTWPGQRAVVTSPEEAVRVVVEAGRPSEPMKGGNP